MHHRDCSMMFFSLVANTLVTGQWYLVNAKAMTLVDEMI